MRLDAYVNTCSIKVGIESPDAISKVEAIAERDRRFCLHLSPMSAKPDWILVTRIILTLTLYATQTSRARTRVEKMGNFAFIFHTMKDAVLCMSCGPVTPFISQNCVTEIGFLNTYPTLCPS